MSALPSVCMHSLVLPWFTKKIRQLVSGPLITYDKIKKGIDSGTLLIYIAVCIYWIEIRRGEGSESE